MNWIGLVWLRITVSERGFELDWTGLAKDSGMKTR